jgi:asparagine synthase (glutamine-hydrolysing)
MRTPPSARPGRSAGAGYGPWLALTQYDVPTLYSLKGEVVRRGVKALFGVDMPVFEKRRFQHGAIRKETLRAKLPAQEAVYRREFHRIYQPQ